MRTMLVVAVAVTLGAVACKGKSESKKGKGPPAPPPLAGLAAVPASASVVIGVDVAKLRDAPLARRAVARMFARDPGLAPRIDAIAKPCKIDLGADVDAALIAMRKLDESLLVATGRFENVSLAQCVSAAMTQGGGQLTTKQIGGRPAYRAKGAAGRGVWFARGGPRTLIISSSESWLAAALSPGQGPRRIQGLLDRVKQDAPIWVAAEVPARVGQGLVQTSGGKLAQGPSALFGEFRLSSGLSGRAGFEMSTEADANALLSLAKAQIGFIAMAAQRLKLGTLVSKVKVDAEAKTVYLRVSLDEADVKLLTSRIDTPKAPEQDTQSQRDASPE